MSRKASPAVLAVARAMWPEEGDAETEAYRLALAKVALEQIPASKDAEVTQRACVEQLQGFFSAEYLRASDGDVDGEDLPDDAETDVTPPDASPPDDVDLGEDDATPSAEENGAEADGVADRPLAGPSRFDPAEAARDPVDPADLAFRARFAEVWDVPLEEIDQALPELADYYGVLKAFYETIAAWLDFDLENASPAEVQERLETRLREGDTNSVALPDLLQLCAVRVTQGLQRELALGKALGPESRATALRHSLALHSLLEVLDQWDAPEDDGAAS